MTTPTTVNIRLQLRADTAANWTAANPILLANEVGLETDTKKLKVGDGSTAWASLAYFPSIVSGGTVLGNLEIGSTGTLTFEGSTADGFETTLAVTDPTADRTITLPNQSGTVVVSGNASIVDADIAAGAEIAVSKLANGTANQVLVTDGTDVSWSDNLTLAGNLTVNGTTTTINTQDLLVEDKNIIIGNVDTPDDTTANAGGITLKGATDKTINWYDATDAWTSSERFSVPLGSAASPSLTFTGDENTGLYSPGPDQLALSTNGTGRLFVDEDGAVKVQVDQQGTFPNTLLLRNEATATGAGYNNTGNKISFLGNNLTQSVTDLIGFRSIHNHGLLYAQAYTNTGATTTRIILRASDGPNTDYNGHISFWTGNDSVTERLRINSSGNVGIGSSSPSHPLDVSGIIRSNEGTQQGRLIVGGDGNGVFYKDATSLRVWTRDTSPVTFWVNDSERARIDSSGRLLVGTSSWTGSSNPATGIQLAENYTIAAQQGGGISGNGVRLTGGTTSTSTTVSIPSGHSYSNFIGTLYVALTLFNSATSIIAEYRVKITNGGSTATFTLLDSVDDSGGYAASITPTYNSTDRVITVNTSWTGSVNSSISASLVGAGAGRL